jgi:hypothetical protein
LKRGIKNGTSIWEKVESYHDSTDNYIAENEVTVTITLSEYRKLVQEVATKKYDIDRANSATYEAKRQLEKFKNQYFEELKKEYGENAEDED